MNAWSQPRRTGLLAAALARAEAWFLEPPSQRAASHAPPAPRRPVVVVRGLAPRGGASAVARALVASLARADPAGVAVLVGGPTRAGARIATGAAARLACILQDAGCAARASGRLCLVADHGQLGLAAEGADAPVVIDVAHASPPAEGLGHADVVVLVSSPAVGDALADAVEASLVGAGHRVEVVVNRVEPEDLHSRGERPRRLVIGESRVAAQVALACRDARGPFATPIAELAERCRAAAP